MLDIRRGLFPQYGHFSFIYFLLALLIFTACSADNTVKETPVSTSSVLIPLVEQADTALSEFECTSPATLTPAQAEGPFYTPGSPERTSLLESEMNGIRLTLSGFVLTQDCQPISGAWLDFWQTDDRGEYDNQGYRLRGHQLTDAEGHYQLETIIPGEYPGRPEHIHVKVQAPDGPLLTTQLYFPNAPGNESDSIFTPETLITMEEVEGGFLGTFNFVVENQ